LKKLYLGLSLIGLLGIGAIAVAVVLAIQPRQAKTRNPQIRLWGEDGRHPSLKGSYLAACVFYKLFYQKSPVGNSFTAGLSSSEAYFLQDIAASAVSVP
jgi:hypothetical protein